LITSDLDETTNISTLNSSGSGSFNYTSVTIRPSVTSRTVICNIAGPLFNIAGGDNLTIDGRVGGTGSSKQLTFSNINTSGNIITFSGSGNNNTVKYCVLKSANSSTSNGTVCFQDCSNNTIDNCDIGDNTSIAANAILSNGNPNSGMTISNCNIFNFWTPSASSKGIYLLNSSGSTGWTISNNNFYQTATRTSSIQ